MNLLKKFIRNDEPEDENEDYNDLYVGEGDIPFESSVSNEEASLASLNDPSRKVPELHRATDSEKVSLKLLQPKSHTEAMKIADQLKEGSIVLLDIANLERDQARRLVDFLAGVAYVLGGEMVRSNKNTIIVSPAGVDISGFVSETVEDRASEESEDPENNEERF